MVSYTILPPTRRKIIKIKYNVPFYSVRRTIKRRQTLIAAIMYLQHGVIYITQCILKYLKRANIIICVYQCVQCVRKGNDNDIESCHVQYHVIDRFQNETQFDRCCCRGFWEHFNFALRFKNVIKIDNDYVAL